MLFSRGKDKFYELLYKMAVNLHESATYFTESKMRGTGDLKLFSTTVKDFELKGDTYIHSVISELNRAFVTPIEREDILQLAMSMDDIVDGIDRCAGLFEMYSIVKADEHMLKFAEIILLCSAEIVRSIELLSEKKLVDIRVQSVKIKDYESTCDNLLRTAVKQLFAIEKDVVKIIQYKEIYETFEDVVDRCQDVANVLETIIMKNA